MGEECPGMALLDDIGGDWTRPAGFPDGLMQKVLAGSLDEAAKIGHRTRLVRFEPGADTAAPFVHDYREEAFLVSGDLQDRAGAVFRPGSYVCRPPGTSHGPFISANGCILLETHYYDRRV